MVALIQHYRVEMTFLDFYYPDILVFVLGLDLSFQVCIEVAYLVNQGRILVLPWAA